MGVDGIEITHCGPNQKRTLMTLFGEVKVSRLGYRAKEASMYFPMDEVMNPPNGKYFPLLRERLAKEVAKGSFEDAIESIKANTGGKVRKRQAEILSRIVSHEFEEFYAHKPVIKRKDLLVISADSKGIVVRKEDLRPTTKAASKRSEHKLKTGLSRGEKRKLISITYENSEPKNESQLLYSNLIADLFHLDKQLANSAYIISTAIFLIVMLPMYIAIISFF